MVDITIFEFSPLLPLDYFSLFLPSRGCDNRRSIHVCLSSDVYCNIDHHIYIQNLSRQKTKKARNYYTYISTEDRRSINSIFLDVVVDGHIIHSPSQGHLIWCEIRQNFNHSRPAQTEVVLHRDSSSYWITKHLHFAAILWHTIFFSFYIWWTVRYVRESLTKFCWRNNICPNSLTRTYFSKLVISQIIYYYKTFLLYMYSLCTFLKATSNWKSNFLLDKISCFISI